MMFIIECSAFGLTVSEKKREAICMSTPHAHPDRKKMDAAGPSYKQRESFVYLGGSVPRTPDATAENTRRKHEAWVHVRNYKDKVYDRPNVPLTLKVGVVKAKVVEALCAGAGREPSAKTSTPNSAS